MKTKKTQEELLKLEKREKEKSLLKEKYKNLYNEYNSNSLKF